MELFEVNMAVSLEELRRRGFDSSYRSGEGGVRVGCSQCQACVINRVACHETGCPNQRKTEKGTRRLDD